MEKPVLRLVCSVSLIVISAVHSELYIGDFCTLDTTNQIGQCHLLENCLSAKEDLLHNIYPKTCGFRGSKPIVCCLNFVYQTTTENYNKNEYDFTEDYSSNEVEGVKSKRKCRQFSKYGMARTSLFIQEKSTQCTLTHSNDSDKKVSAKEFPHVAIIGYNVTANQKKWKCVGSLISDQFVLTAAHCLFNKDFGEAKYIRLGDSNLPGEDIPYTEEYGIVQLFQHPDYYPPSRYNDIGLLKMDRPAILDQYIRPACLGTELTVASKPATSIDWRKFEYHVDHVDLIKSTVNLLSQTYCNNSYQKDFVHKLPLGIISKSQICSEHASLQEEACESNFGGILQVPTRGIPCTYSIIGIKSISKGCGSGLYTRVSRYLSWIEDIVWPNLPQY